MRSKTGRCPVIHQVIAYSFIPFLVLQKDVKEEKTYQTELPGSIDSHLKVEK